MSELWRRVREDVAATPIPFHVFQAIGVTADGLRTKNGPGAAPPCRRPVHDALRPIPTRERRDMNGTQDRPLLALALACLVCVGVPLGTVVAQESTLDPSADATTVEEVTALRKTAEVDSSLSESERASVLRLYDLALGSICLLYTSPSPRDS